MVYNRIVEIDPYDGLAYWQCCMHMVTRTALTVPCAVSFATASRNVAVVHTWPTPRRELHHRKRPGSQS
jgi:hypothetical protein